MRFMANIPGEKMIDWTNFKVGSVVEVDRYNLDKYAKVIFEGIGPNGSGVIQKVAGEEAYVKYTFNDGVLTNSVRYFWIPKDKLTPPFLFTRLLFWGIFYTLKKLFVKWDKDA